MKIILSRSIYGLWVKKTQINSKTLHFLPILCVRVTGTVVWAGTPRLRSPWTRPPALSSDIVMPTSHRSSLGSLPGWTCQETTSRGKRWWGMRDTAQATSALVPLDVEKQRVYSKLRTPKLFTLSLRQRKLVSATFIHLLVLSLMIQSSFISAYGHDAKFMTIVATSVDWLTILRASSTSLPQQTNTTTRLWLLDCGCCTNSPVILTPEEDSEILKLLNLRQLFSSELGQKESHPCPALDLEMPTLIPVVKQLNCKPPQCVMKVLVQKSQQDNFIYKRAELKFTGSHSGPGPISLISII